MFPPSINPSKRRHEGRRPDLGTLQARIEAWEDHCAEPAVVDRHGAIVWVIAGCRLALVHDLDD